MTEQSRETGVGNWNPRPEPQTGAPDQSHKPQTGARRPELEAPDHRGPSAAHSRTRQILPVGMSWAQPKPESRGGHRPLFLKP